MTLLQVCEWLETYELFNSYYIGKIDGTEENVLGVFARAQTMRPPRALGQKSKYALTGVKLLVHGTNDEDETQNLAISLFNILTDVREVTFEDELIYFCDLRVNEPLDVGTDANNIYEFVINVDIYSRKEE